MGYFRGARISQQQRIVISPRPAVIFSIWKFDKLFSVCAAAAAAARTCLPVRIESFYIIRLIVAAALQSTTIVIKYLILLRKFHTWKTNFSIFAACTLCGLF